MTEPIARPIGRQPARFAPHDPRAAVVAQRVMDAASEAMSDLHLEHVGSTSVPGCPGKGYVDLMTEYVEGRLEVVWQALESLGMAELGDEIRHLFPPERPVFHGLVKHAGDDFVVVVHVLAAGAWECGALSHLPRPIASR